MNGESEILTATGYTTVNKLQVGDFLFDNTNCLTKIISIDKVIEPVQTFQNYYNKTVTYGESLELSLIFNLKPLLCKSNDTRKFVQSTVQPIYFKCQDSKDVDYREPEPVIPSAKVLVHVNWTERPNYIPLIILIMLCFKHLGRVEVSTVERWIHSQFEIHTNVFDIQQTINRARVFENHNLLYKLLDPYFHTFLTVNEVKHLITVRNDDNDLKLKLLIASSEFYMTPCNCHGVHEILISGIKHPHAERLFKQYTVPLNYLDRDETFPITTSIGNIVENYDNFTHFYLEIVHGVFNSDTHTIRLNDPDLLYTLITYYKRHTKLTIGSRRQDVDTNVGVIDFLNSEALKGPRSYHDVADPRKIAIINQFRKFNIIPSAKQHSRLTRSPVPELFHHLCWSEHTFMILTIIQLSGYINPDNVLTINSNNVHYLHFARRLMQELAVPVSLNKRGNKPYLAIHSPSIFDIIGLPADEKFQGFIAKKKTFTTPDLKPIGSLVAKPAPMMMYTIKTQSGTFLTADGAIVHCL